MNCSLPSIGRNMAQSITRAGHLCSSFWSWRTWLQKISSPCCAKKMIEKLRGVPVFISWIRTRKHRKTIGHPQCHQGVQQQKSGLLNRTNLDCNKQMAMFNWKSSVWAAWGWKSHCGHQESPIWDKIVSHSLRQTPSHPWYLPVTDEF